MPYRAFDLIIDDLATELAGHPRLAREIEHAGALCRVFPVLAPLVDPELGEGAQAADLRVERERGLLAMAELFQTLLRAPRGVVVIDDLQWADEDSLELLALVVERVEKPLTVLASWTANLTAIPEAQRLLLERLGEAVTLVDIQDLAQDDLALLIGELAPNLPANKLRAAAALAAGSPYLAELIDKTNYPIIINKMFCISDNGELGSDATTASNGIKIQTTIRPIIESSTLSKASSETTSETILSD